MIWIGINQILLDIVCIFAVDEHLKLKKIDGIIKKVLIITFPARNSWGVVWGVHDFEVLTLYDVSLIYCAIELLF